VLGVFPYVASFCSNSRNQPFHQRPRDAGFAVEDWSTHEVSPLLPRLGVHGMDDLGCHC